jgi:eukaryotic-like serine/threonine-protein kinase
MVPKPDAAGASNPSQLRLPRALVGVYRYWCRMVSMGMTDQNIAGYEVLSVLGHGASSTIYAVMDPRNQQVYAIKRVMLNAPSDQRFIEQALIEHEVASRMDHPALRKSHRIIRRRKVIRTTELLVLMEFVDGSTLEQHRPQTAEETVDVFLAAASGLGAMHQAGYVHCDIKPNNIVVGTDGVKIIDFGHACPVNTIKKRIQGTPDYIAPEQVLRKTITPRTDVFNLGATMYWCLTNHHVPTLIPKSGKSIDLKAMTDLKPPIEFNEDVPRGLNVMVLNCLEIDPQYRPASMQEITDRLQTILLYLQRKKSVDSGGDEELDEQHKSTA